MNNFDLYHARVRLVQLELKIVSLPDQIEKSILLREVEEAKRLLDEDDAEYAKMLCQDIGSAVRRLKLHAVFLPQASSSNIQLILRGIVYYLLIVVVFACIAVALHKYDPSSPAWSQGVLGVLNPLFQMAQKLDIQPEGFFYGLFGGAGAVVSLVKRFDELSEAKGSPWLFLSLGLFNPIVGSLAAIIICRFAREGLTENLQGIPILVIAFFSGFSERLLSKVDEKVGS